MNEYLSQTDLGKLFGATSHAIGRWLVECGLRTEQKKPSAKAFNEGYVSQAPTGRGGADGYFYVWHRQKTVAALQAAGHRLKPTFDLSLDGRLKGPFRAAQSSVNGFEIIDSGGTVSIWVVGEKNAESVIALLNLAHKHGKFAPVKEEPPF